ncbi:hypothetical protein VIBNISFn27_220001 [Vibrio nigripulchritudo SFn27]|uniref:DUF4062 domain-containing protein n=1 Tax=Vibrio nigripulchritudo TaxID=28173 RepID=U4KGM6_9VIBR|nr:DUF4062 domain-containing protein [Vibrio nigripulchritudo]CCN80932.1 hypothetical protein VIBNIBLFn1_1130163 [Vibrio nigripulchritudo BLFn1]CCN87951.1 hypothetical protein VIBNISFn27_220001 [Vibrio nigripulchritudo SFn27]CCN96805.1 hypothetical protein VIBNIENn2_850001 [Vibrio nigripulchritudo ENn2]CCO43541.1 hypothetical protein VIBNISFn135_960164 [Vibrio nigripulchritudo SFn135]CCO51553.1 hypothetical protein VIBNIWn13_130001 [Vibrio nigripulchritudo Wn13]
MNKKFQVFISSTYRDLKDERIAVAQNVLELNHIPVGMEFFGASDLQQLEFIKAQIDQTDYYVLIIGGKYGSIDPSSGKSYTQLEYEYAVSKGIPVLVFLRAERHSLPIEQRETSGTSIQLLDAFIEGASGNKRIRAEWRNLDELVLQTSNALNKEMNRTASSRVGWVRADTLTSESDQIEIAHLRKQLNEIESQREKFFFNPKDAQSIYDSVEQIVEALKKPDVTPEEKNELRRAASSRLLDLVNLGLQSEASPNLLFNSAVNARRLDMDVAALQLATLSEHLQASYSHKLAVLFSQCKTGSAYEVVEENGLNSLKKLNTPSSQIAENALNKALLLAADSPIPQCEIIYSQIWNICQNMREHLGVEKMLCVLLRSKYSREDRELPEELASLMIDMPILDDFDWKEQSGKTVPSYMVGKIVDCIAFLSPKNWKTVFISNVLEAFSIHQNESLMVTWAESFRRDVLQTAHRTKMLSEVAENLEENLGINLQEFMSL